MRGDQDLTLLRPILRTILRNQRLIMLGLANLVRDGGGPGSGYHADNLRQAIIDMEREHDWIAPPSQRISDAK